MEVNKYKIIISNKNIYEEIEIPVDAKVYRVGTSIESDYRLYRDAFFENVQLDFSNNNGSWMVMCSDNIYITLGDTKRLLMKTSMKMNMFGRHIFLWEKNCVMKWKRLIIYLLQLVLVELWQVHLKK